jgi:hypothetical protein
MVSTRSQSRISASSLVEGGGDDTGAEVSSAEVGSTCTKESQQIGKRLHRRLTAIDEEGLPVNLNTSSSRGQSADAAEDVQEVLGGRGPATEPHELDSREPSFTEADLLDRLAHEMYAALDEAFGDGSDADMSEASGGDPIISSQNAVGPQDGAAGEDDSSRLHGNGDGAVAQLQWRPELQLPSNPDLRRGSRATASAPADKPQSRAKMVSFLGSHTTPPYLCHLLIFHSLHVCVLLHSTFPFTVLQLHLPPKDRSVAQRQSCRARPNTAGPAWFNLPATEITEDVKRDLRLLRLRPALDPKAFYKKLDTTKFPKYFQVGTVVESAADFYSGR